MKIGVIASSNGGVFEAARRVLGSVRKRRDEFVVITDRVCGIERLCRTGETRLQRIETHDNRDFSRSAAACFEQHGGVDVVVLFFLRLVTEELLEDYPTFNVHPSLLPAFPGFRPIARARDARVRFLGATLHLANERADAGPIAAQTVLPIRSSANEAELQKFSFVQKVFLFLLLVQLHESQALRLGDKNRDLTVCPDMPFTDRCNPMLTDAGLLEGVLKLQAQEGVEVIR